MTIEDVYKLMESDDKNYHDPLLWSILADLHEEAGKVKIAQTIRWMIRNNKRPYRFIDGSYWWYAGKGYTQYLPVELIAKLNPYNDYRSRLMYLSVEECIDELSVVDNLQQYRD